MIKYIFKSNVILAKQSLALSNKTVFFFAAGDSRCGTVARGPESRCHLVCGRWMGRRKLQLKRSEFNSISLRYHQLILNTH